MNGLVSINFKLALVVTTLGCAVMFFGNSPGLAGFTTYPGAQIIAPVVIGLLTPVLWFFAYRHGAGHLPAFFIGFSLFVAALGSRLSGVSYSGEEQVFLLYAGLSHIAYALLEWEELMKVLRSDGD